MIAEAQILLLPLDVIDSRENTNIDMYVFWQIIYMSSLFMNTLVIPFAYFFFNTDEDIDHVSNIFQSLNYFDDKYRKRGSAQHSETKLCT